MNNEKSEQENEEQIDCFNKTAIYSKSVGQGPCHEDTNIFKDSISSFGTTSLMGPVVKLPMETKIVMRVEDSCSHHNAKKPKPKADSVNIMNKIEAVSIYMYKYTVYTNKQRLTLKPIRSNVIKLCLC